MGMGWLAELWGEPGLCLMAMVVMGAVTTRSRRAARRSRFEAGREQRIRKELELYAELDVSLGAELHAGRPAVDAAKSLGRRVCRAVTERSIFSRVAVMLRDADGRFACVGRAGIDDLTLEALEAWGQNVQAEERGGKEQAGARNGDRSFSISLGDWRDFDAEVGSWATSGRKERRRNRRGVVVPFRNGAGAGNAGKISGAIIVCTDGAGFDELVVGEGLTRALGPIEALAGRIAATLENEAMAERLLRAEKLAGLGQLAGGVAHALNNPLTAVLGFAELIAEGAADARVRDDAAMIVGEALKMKQTIGRLIELWRPTTARDEQVDVAAMLQDLETACAEKLRGRNLRLELMVPEDVPRLRGGSSRLREMMEHLLNNAAQAIAGYRPLEDGEGEHSIRVTVSFDDRALHLIVSDTGPGFATPGRVFDPFYTTGEPDAAAGMGLSICYGIAREHGGTISAFNLHPHGAAVVVELPRTAVVEGFELVEPDPVIAYVPVAGWADVGGPTSPMPAPTRMRSS